MNPAYRDILKHSTVYGVGQILTRLASFLLLPLYTSYLRPADYGCIAILDVTAGVLGILVGSGMASAVSRYHFEAHSEKERDRVWWTGLTFVALMATAIVAPAWLFRDALARVTLGAEQSDGGYFYALVLSTLWFGVIGQLLDQYLRVRKWSGLYVSVSLARLCLNIGLNVYFLVVLQLGIAGILWGNLIAGGAAATVQSAIFVGSRGPYAFHRPLLAKLWQFGGPLIVTALLATLMHQADRYLLRLFLDLDQVGIYSLAYTIGQAVNTLVLLPFSAIWCVVIYEIAERSDAKRVYTVVFEYFVYGLALIMFGVSLFAKPIVSVMAAADYAAAAELIPIVCLAYLFFSLHSHFSVPALLAKKTVRLLPAYSVAAAANVGMNLLLIPLLGPIGAAWTSVLTFALFSFTGLAIYRRIDRYDYHLLRCALAVLGMVSCYLVLGFLDRLGMSGSTQVVYATVIWCIWAGALFGQLLSTLTRQYWATRHTTVGEPLEGQIS